MSEEEKTPPPMIAITWEDAKVLGDATWLENKKREYVPHIFYKVGFLILDDERGVHMVSDWHPELISQPDQIPRAMIRSLTYLEPQKSTPTKGKRDAGTKNPRR